MTQAWSRVALPIFINLCLCPLRERKVKVLMAQGAIQRGVMSAAMEVVMIWGKLGFIENTAKNSRNKA